MTAAIYVRVSSLDQNDDMQVTELRGLVKRMGWDIVEYAEKKSSVKKRPVYEKLMEDARSRKFDVVVVFMLDRWARSLPDLLNSIRTLDSYGIRFLCPRQGVDTDRQSPLATLTMQILGAVAQFERAIIVERVRAGVAEAQRQGKHCGRPGKVFRRDEAIKLRAAGMSWRKIAAKMKVPVSTLRRAVPKVISENPKNVK